MGLSFNWKYKDYQLRSVPKGLARMNEVEENHTIELVKWKEGHCFTLAYWRLTSNGYTLTPVADRMFEYIDLMDLEPIWEKMHQAQKSLDKFEVELTFKEFEDDYRFMAGK